MVKTLVGAFNREGPSSGTMKLHEGSLTALLNTSLVVEQSVHFNQLGHNTFIGVRRAGGGSERGRPDRLTEKVTGLGPVHAVRMDLHIKDIS